MTRPSPDHTGSFGPEPPENCSRCPRLFAFLQEQRAKEPSWHNRPVPSFGDPNAELLIVGLAPGLKGANRTGRPFTGDYAGDLLYKTLDQFGFANGAFDARPDDGLILTKTAVTNAVRCVPPQNKPTGGEINTCRPFLVSTLSSYAHLKAILCLGRISHESTLRALGIPLKAAPFAHAARHNLGDVVVFDSYHCSRYNTNTGRLTEAMFRDVLSAIRSHLDGS